MASCSGPVMPSVAQGIASIASKLPGIGVGIGVDGNTGVEVGTGVGVGVGVAVGVGVGVAVGVGVGVGVGTGVGTGVGVGVGTGVGVGKGVDVETGAEARSGTGIGEITCTPVAVGKPAPRYLCRGLDRGARAIGAGRADQDYGSRYCERNRLQGSLSARKHVRQNP